MRYYLFLEIIRIQRLQILALRLPADADSVLRYINQQLRVYFREHLEAVQSPCVRKSHRHSTCRSLRSARPPRVAQATCNGSRPDVRRCGRCRLLQLAADCYSEIADLQIVLFIKRMFAGFISLWYISFLLNEADSLQYLDEISEHWIVGQRPLISEFVCERPARHIFHYAHCLEVLLVAN